MGKNLTLAESTNTELVFNGVKLPADSAKELNLEVGDCVKIYSLKSTVGEYLGSNSVDNGLNIIRVSDNLKDSLQVSSGDEVHVEKVTAKDCEKLVLAPESGVRVNMKNFPSKKLIGTFLSKGDKIPVKELNGLQIGDSNKLDFLVVDCEPDEFVNITESTEIEVKSELEKGVLEGNIEIDSSNVVDLAEKPVLKDKVQLESKQDLKKISDGRQMIGKFTTSDKIYWDTFEYYYIEERG